MSASKRQKREAAQRRVEERQAKREQHRQREARRALEDARQRDIDADLPMYIQRDVFARRERESQRPPMPPIIRTRRNPA